ncbi:hypothetical protein [Staphylospora marina]|uniref:hypothetical protein n=1 Tax=Staphylospora marina TaxID=2490858 RepID=UPI0013DDE072|nr:hypothetical protein [Staphylospora marina]
MNRDAAIFACRFTGFAGLAASLFLWKVAGTGSFLAGLVGSACWFVLGETVRRRRGQ